MQTILVYYISLLAFSPMISLTPPLSPSRVPGNAAAVQLLQEELDSKEPESINFEEEVIYLLFTIPSEVST